MIQDLLYYGYNPSCSSSDLLTLVRETATKDKYTESKTDLLDKGKNALQDAFDNELQEIGTDSVHVVPLSSGLDSRTILGYLLDHPNLDLEQIRTVTFGTPGSWDYEIGQQVADEMDVENIVIDLTSSSFDWSIKQLREYAQTRDNPIPMFEGYINSTAVNQFGKNTTVWSGFLGDPTAGAHQPTTPATDWEIAQERFVENNRVTDLLVDLSYDPMNALPSEPYFGSDKLSYEEQLDFAHRQQCFISPLVLFQPHRYATPFTRPEWLSFSLNLPHKHRQNRDLFIDMMKNKFPKLFSLPTDINNGLCLEANPIEEKVNTLYHKLREEFIRPFYPEFTSKNMNYVDFNMMYRRGGELAATTESLLHTFDQREITSRIDAVEFWERHQSGEDLAREIRILCSLELFLGT